MSIFVLDTNVLIHDPYALFAFGRHTVDLHVKIIEEIDKFKSDHDPRGFSAREASRLLDKLFDGVPIASAEARTEQGGMIRICFDKEKYDVLPPGLEHSVDNLILSYALDLQRKKDEGEVVLVSKDTNMRLKARALGLAYQDYHDPNGTTEHGRKSYDIVNVEVGCDALTQLGSNGELSSEGYNIECLAHNQCCRLLFGERYLLAVYNPDYKRFRLVAKAAAHKNREGGIRPRNDEQAFALHLLSDPEISVVFLLGKAGTGKTLLPLWAGYEGLERDYTALHIYRPTIEAGETLGFLPGTLDEKMAPWKMPIIDALNVFLGPRHRKDDSRKSAKGGLFSPAAELISEGLIEIAPLNYLLGRTLSRAYLIIDEAQQLTWRQLKLVLTRAGEGTKAVVAGDVAQIHSPYLNERTSGLTVGVAKLANHPMSASIMLSKSERSPFAEWVGGL